MFAIRVTSTGLILALAAVFTMAFWPTVASAGDGDKLWGESDVLVAEIGEPLLTDLQAVADGNGGGILVWRHILEYDPYHVRIEAARVSHDGLVLWSSYITPATQVLFFDVTSDHRGGVIVAYINGIGDDAGYDVYAQRLNPDGEQVWVTEDSMGTRLSHSFNHFQYAGYDAYPFTASDGIGGAYVSWQDRLAYVDPAGTLSPGLDGIKLIPGDTVRWSFAMVGDG
ncbi:MAG: hypothetical protein OEQ74_10640, partial [Gammaproteobacteria bacterium]|nr:hypothetical protein [Gammaproteobacteria bacterium]